MAAPDLSSLYGLIITAGGSVVVAGIGAWAMLEAKRRPPAAEPTPIQDVWDENRKRGDEIVVLNAELRVLRAAIGVLLDWVERALRDWLHRPDVPPPALSRREFEILEKTGEELPFSPAYDRGSNAEPQPIRTDEESRA